MPVLSDYSRKKKIDYFLKPIPKNARILEIGCGARWVRDYLVDNGWNHYVGMDLVPPADIVGDILKWRELGLEPESYDVIIAFEVVEHVDCFKQCFDLLKPGGKLLISSPVPHLDWVMRTLEVFRLNQQRTSSHDHLIYFREIPYFNQKDIKIVGLLAQWGVLTKTVGSR